MCKKAAIHPQPKPITVAFQVQSFNKGTRLLDTPKTMINVTNGYNMNFQIWGLLFMDI